MSADDVPDPSRMTGLEYIRVENVPAEYATAMLRAWRPEVPKGVYLSVIKARKPERVAQNLTNPLRGWDGRQGIPRRAYAKALSAWTPTSSARPPPPPASTGTRLLSVVLDDDVEVGVRH